MGCDEMRDSCTEVDCFCGHCEGEVTYNIWKDLTAESDQYGQTPNCEICDKVWAECNPFEGPHDAQCIQEHFEAYWITTAIAINYFGPTPKHHEFATPLNIHDFPLPYTIQCLTSMKENIDIWLTEMEDEKYEKSE